MCAFLRYSAGGLTALLATAYVTVSAENGLSAFRPTVMEPMSEAQTIVNRTNKGDRQLAIREMSVPAQRALNNPAAVEKEQEILEGCDTAFSPLTASAQNNFASRCMA